MYKVHIYCTIPKHVEINENVIRELKYRKLVNGGYIVKDFKDLDALYCYVKSFDYKPFWGKGMRNQFLEAVMCNPNDSRRHRIAVEKRVHSYHRNTIGDLVFSDEPYIALGYLVKDAKGRVIDLRTHKKAIDNFNVKDYYRRINDGYWERKWVIREANWEKAARLYEGERYWGCYRQLNTIQERRNTCNPEHKPFVRGARSKSNLPDSWDDKVYIRQKSWKARDKKARKPWEVNLNNHIDTVKTSPIIEMGEVDTLKD